MAIDYTSTTTVVLGEGEAAFPVQCSFPSAIGKILQQVISMADSRIQLDTTFQSVYPQWRYTYNQFAIAAPVDRFTQFWREFNGNLQSLLLLDPYVIQFVCAYEASLDSAIDPLGDPSVYGTVRTDANSRSRSWVPGSPCSPSRSPRSSCTPAMPRRRTLTTTGGQGGCSAPWRTSPGRTSRGSPSLCSRRCWGATRRRRT